MPATCIHDQTRGHCPVCRMDALEAHFGVPADHDDLNGADGDRDADRDADRDLRTDGGSNNGAPGHHLGGPYECARCGEEFVNLANVLKCCGEELGERTDSNDPRLRTDGGVDTVLACPECDRAAVNTRGRGRNSLDDGEAKYRCSACRSYFDDPVERPSRDTGGAGRKGLSKRLADMDADDLRADGGVDTDQTVPACPDCGAAHVRVFGRRGSAGNRSVDADEANYRCDACGAHFDDYDERPSLNTTSTRHGLSKRLGDMDADDLRADGSGHSPAEVPDAIDVPDDASESERVEAAIELAEARIESGHLPIVAADVAAERLGILKRSRDIHDAVRAVREDGGGEAGE